MHAGNRHFHRRILAIALPMIVSNLSVPLVGLVDNAVAGHLSEAAYLGAITIGTTLFNFLFLGLNFLRMGTTGVTARAYGNGDFDAARSALMQSVSLALLLGLALIAVRGPVREIAMPLFAPGADVAASTRQYFDVRIWSAPFVLVNYALLGWFLGMQTGRAPLLMMLVTNLANMALDVALVFGLGMRADGIALASLLGEIGGTAAGIWLAAGLLRRHRGHWNWSGLRRAGAWRGLLGINANIFVRTLCLMFTFAFFTAQSARFGDVTLAANGLLLGLQSVLSYGLDGFAHAAEALIGRALGRRDGNDFRAALRGVMLWSLAVAGGYTVVYLGAGRGILYLLTDLPAVRDAAIRYLPWLIVSPLVSVWSFVFDGVFIGATWSRSMRNSMLVSTLLVFLPLWWLSRDWSNHGLWLAFLGFLAARGATMGLLLHRRQRSLFAGG